MATKIKTVILMTLFITFTILVLMPTPSQSKTYLKGKVFVQTNGRAACECPDDDESCYCELTDISGV